MSFQRIASEEVWSGRIASVRIDTFRYEDGEEARREIVDHPGAVAVLAFDGEALHLVRQPREPVGEPALLELPAGKLDVDGEPPLATARRELAEEIGMAAGRWRSLTRFYSSPGLLSEELHLFLAEDLREQRGRTGEHERIELARVPLAGLDDAIAEVRDAKTLVGLLWFRAYLAP